MLRIFAASFALLLAIAGPMDAQETAASLSKRVEASIFAKPAVTMKFRLPSEGQVKATVDLLGHKIRIESASTLIVSNGSTVWNLSKPANKVTIDNVAKTSSPFADPASLFRFSKNYTATLTQNSGLYTLELTPNHEIASLLKAAGDAQQLILTVKATGKSVKIVKASVRSSRGNSETSALTISAAKPHKEDFNFKLPAGAKLLDLRE